MSRAWCYVILAVMYLFQGVFNGVGDTVTTMVAMMAMAVVRLPMAYLFTGPLGMDYRGAWITFPITWCIGAGVMFYHYKSESWKRKVMQKLVSSEKMAENGRKAYSKSQL